jgi:dTDP-4-dehydrorhamnose reductase
MILLLGGSGYIGSAFRACFDSRGIEYRDVRRSECNYYVHERLDELIAETAPGLLINAAGFTGKPNVDACELQKSDCILGNVLLPSVIRDVCERRELPWGHVSSGCIYTGNRSDGNGFCETDAPNFTFRHNNCSFYSGCKALAEEILKDASQCYVWRLRIPFTHVDSDRNYLSKLMRYPRLLDVRNSLADLVEFVTACFDCWQQRLEFGVYNLTNTGSITTREVAAMIQGHGLHDSQFEFFASEEEFMQTTAKTPRSSCVLDNTKARKAGLRLSHVSDAISQSLRKWQADSLWKVGREAYRTFSCAPFVSA